jgi:hypothetical protein
MHYIPYAARKRKDGGLAGQRGPRQYQRDRVGTVDGEVFIAMQPHGMPYPV